MRVLLATPPMTQVNGPYPATPYLTGYLQSLGHEVVQTDMGLELILRVFSRSGLRQIYDVLSPQQKKIKSDSVHFFLESFPDYQNTIEAVISFLQGKDPTLALRLAGRSLVPEGPRFLPLQEHGKQILELFGAMGTQDLAKYIASLYLDDLADVLREGIDPDFQFSRYAESLASSEASFEPLRLKLESPMNVLDQMLQALWQEHLKKQNPEVICLTLPFPGNVYAGFRLAKWSKEWNPEVKVLMGGGFVNTELRELSDPRVFDWVDALTYDDGELPLQQLFQFFAGKVGLDQLVRTKMRSMSGQVEFWNQKSLPEIPFSQRPRPIYAGLPLGDYFAMLEMPNPMHRMWSDFRWNKIVLAHGCYWKRCSFCDVHLDYIGRYDPAKAEALVEQMVQIQKETGSSGFHFVDEAAPPALLRALSKEILRRKLHFTWWGNLRFDQQFDPELCELMRDAGCVAVTGGLEVASPRILKLINKGITVEQVAQVTKNFSRSRIFVHAYLMYGFPTQTVQETVDSLETVRQLFRMGCLQSAHWHRFLATVHSPVGKNPQEYGVRLPAIEGPQEGLFARYSVPFEDRTDVDHDELGAGLRKALYNFMHGIGLNEDVRNWFNQKLPAPRVKKTWLESSLSAGEAGQSSSPKLRVRKK